MMYLKVVLASALVAAVSGQLITSSTTRRPSLGFGYQNTINSLGASAKAGIGLFNTTGQTGVKVVNDGVQGFTNAGKQVVNTVSGMKSTALHGGVTGFKQGVDIATNLAGIMPGMGGIASVGGGWAKTGADVANMAGQTGISIGSGIENGKLQLASGLTNAGAGLASSGINMGTGMATSGVDTLQRLANGAFGNVGNVMDTAVNYVNQASGMLSSKASAIADKMSVSTPSLPSSFSVPSLMNNIPVSSALNGAVVSGAAVPTLGNTNVRVQVAA